MMAVILQLLLCFNLWLITLTLHVAVLNLHDIPSRLSIFPILVGLRNVLPHNLVWRLCFTWEATNLTAKPSTWTARVVLFAGRLQGSFVYTKRHTAMWWVAIKIILKLNPP